MAGFVPGPFDPALPAKLATLTMPILIQWGAVDRIVPPEHLPFWEAALPEAEVAVYPGIGHLLYHEHRAGGRRDRRVRAMTVRSSGEPIAPPEPGLTPDELVARGGRAAPEADRRAGRDRGAHLSLRGAPPGLPGRRLLPLLRAAPLRWLRVRRLDVHADDAGALARLRLDRLVRVARLRARPADRLVVGRAGAGGDLRRRRFPLRLGRRADRHRDPHRRRLGAQRQGRLRIGHPVLDPLHGPGADRRRGRQADRAHAAVRRAAQRVHRARRLGGAAGPQGLGLAEHRLRGRAHPRALGARGRADGRLRRERGHRRLRAARQPALRRPRDGVLHAHARRGHGRRGLPGARRVRADDEQQADAAAAEHPPARRRDLPALVRLGARQDRHRRGGADALHRASTASSAAATARRARPTPTATTCASAPSRARC